MSYAKGLWIALVIALVAAALPPAAASVEAGSWVRWGYYVTYAANSNTTLTANIHRFTHISPYYYVLRADGSLGSTEQPATTAFIRSQGVKVLPMVTNQARHEDFHTFLETPEKMAAAVETVAGIALRPEYDGVHVDFEGLDGADRALLTEFMQRLSARVRPAGKLVSQAIAAKTRETTTGWAGAYDYTELGKYNDLVVIMAYDYSFSDGQAGPIAPIDWVRRVAAYSRATLGAAVTVLGAPLYGYDWITNREPRERAKSLTYAMALETIAQRNGQRGYDETYQAEWGRYRQGEEEHEVWFESARSLRPKLEIMRNEGLAGVALWRLGHEDPGIWAVLDDGATPASPAPALAVTREQTYFRETRHSLRGAFYRHWRTRGGLSRFGYPLTEEFPELNPQDGRTYTVQYFERARFELHPEFAGTQHEVLLGHVGRWAMAEAGHAPLVPVPPDLGGRFFPETGQVVQNGFLAYWDANGGLAQFGLPLTGEFAERNPDDGKTYTVQYFERARFEWHPEHRGTPHEVQLGHLGRQMLRARGWIP